jgi:hypothetical protein
MEKSATDTKSQTNYYNLFEIHPHSSSKQILLAYENKITKFNNLYSLEQEQVNEIKLLKVGLFVLINCELRKIYDKIIGIKKEQKKETEPVAGNDNIPDSLDALFNVDNSWMKTTENKSDSTGRKVRNESNILGDRVFSMSEFNKRPGFSSDFEIELRKPQQGRIDKSNEKLSKD